MRSSFARRWVHLTLAFGTFAAFTSRSQAVPRTSVEVEATPYGGTTSGELPGGGACAFAPRVATTFGGFGGRVRVRRRDDEDDEDPTRGFTVSAQGAVEYQSHRLISAGSSGERNIPPNQTMIGGALHVGYDLRYFGFYAGAGVREVVDEPTYLCLAGSTDPACATGIVYPRTRASVYPDVGMRFGRADTWHGLLHVGAANLATILRPGIHGGVAYSTRAGHDIALRIGIQSNDAIFFGRAAAPRADLAGTWPLGRVVSIGAGFGIVAQEDRVDFDLRGALSFRLGQ